MYWLRIWFPALLLLSSTAPADQKFLAMGTASLKGVYYPVGRSICELVNRERLDHGLRCIPYATGGSVYNIYAIASRDMDMAITRVDLAYDAYRQQGGFTDLAEGADLRSVSLLFTMPVGILVRAGSGIEGFDDFKGRSINIGNLGSGRRDIAKKLFEVADWTRDDFSAVYEYRTTAMQEAFCAGEVDILIGAFAIPAAFYDTLTRDCDARFLPIPQRIIDTIIEEDPAFEPGRIPGGMYPQNPQDVATVQIGTLLVTSSHADAGAVARLCESLFGQIPEFRKAHPTLAGFGFENMLAAERILPLHEGVQRYMQQSGADQWQENARRSRLEPPWPGAETSQ